MNHMIAVLLRSVALVVVIGLYFYGAMPLLFPGPEADANIGAGLIGFGMLSLVGLVGGVLDGRRFALPRVALTWLVAGLVVGAVLVARLQIGEGVDRAALLMDLSIIPATCASFVAVPALVGGVVGALLRRRPATDTPIS